MQIMTVNDQKHTLFKINFLLPKFSTVKKIMINFKAYVVLSLLYPSITAPS